uniref:Interferon-induced transmembrane protein 3-like n=1 Tax=Sparus aurata TaxID=8175 RepID=A0A671UDF9_SPAAU
MNPAGQLGEPVPLQERYDWSPGQPRGPAVGQYTTLNISSEPPKDHIIWSLYCFVYSNPFCLGLAALIFSIKVLRPKRAAALPWWWCLTVLFCSALVVISWILSLFEFPAAVVSPSPGWVSFCLFCQCGGSI